MDLNLNNIPLIANNKLLKMNNLNEIEKIAPLHNYLLQQQKKGLASQSGIFTEYNICYSIIKYFNLTECETSEQCRLYAKNNNIEFYYLGNPNQNDVRIIYNGKIYEGEIKEPKSKLLEIDLIYDENGKLLPRSNTPNEYFSYIDSFNKETSIFKELGHNYSLKNIGINMVYKDFCSKKVDFILSYDQNNTIIFFNNNFQDINRHMTFEGSEIRTSGRNGIKVFTPKYFNKILSDILIQEDNKNILLDKSKLTPIVGRGRTDITRYKLNKSFFFKTANILKETDSTIYIKKTSIKQLEPTIAVHLNIRRPND